MVGPCSSSVLSSLFFEVNKLVANQSMNCTGGAQVPFFSACITKKVEPIFSSEENVQMRKIVSPRPFCLLHHIAAAVTRGAARRGSGKRRWCGGAGGVEVAAWRRRRRFDPMAYVCKAFHGTNPFSERVGIFKVLIRLYICVRFVRKSGLFSEEGNFNLCKN